MARNFRNLIAVRSREEILANKLVAFSASAMTCTRPHHRDNWDMRHLLTQRTELRSDLVGLRMKERDLPQDWLVLAANQVEGIVRSREFHAEMARFLRPSDMARTLDNPPYPDGLGRDIRDLLRMTDHQLRNASTDSGTEDRCGL